MSRDFKGMTIGEIIQGAAVTVLCAACGYVFVVALFACE